MKKRKHVRMIKDFEPNSVLFAVCEMFRVLITSLMGNVAQC